MKLALAAALFLAGLLVGIGLTGKTEELWISATVKSHHFDSDHPKDYEQSNWGLGLEYEFRKDWRAAVGFYRNSQRINSTYMLGCYVLRLYGPAKLGSCVGMVTGYNVEPDLVLLPVLMVEYKRVGFNLTYIPERKDDRGEKHVAVAALQLKVLW